MKKNQKTEKLFSAVGDIDDIFLAEAASYKRKRKKYFIIPLIAACLAFAIMATSALSLAVIIPVGGLIFAEFSNSEDTFDGFNNIGEAFVERPQNNNSLMPGIDDAEENKTDNVNPGEEGNLPPHPGSDIMGGVQDEDIVVDMNGVRYPELEFNGDVSFPNVIYPEQPNVGDPSQNPDDEMPEFVENSFIKTSENNISTFSSDVDTASYTYFRKLINQGCGFANIKNSGSHFRTEEFINYFKYDVPQPDDGELFGVHASITPCPWNSQTMLFRVTLQAEQAADDKANNLVFLIDVSGSMKSKDKLPLLKTAFSYLVGNLDADDTISIVTYSGSEAIVLDGANGLESEKIMAAINSLVASGSTNGEAGLTMAYQIAEKHYKPDGNNRIIMASDGDLNVGISSTEELTSYIEEKRDQGVYLSVLGFGTGNYKDSKMEALADNGNGVYYYIDGETEAEKVFGTDIFGTLYTVAEDVKLQIEFNSEAIKAYRLIGYENRVMNNEDFENDKKDAGEVGASHQVTVFYEIEPTRTEQEHDYYMILRVRYKNPGESLSMLDEYVLGDEIISFDPDGDTRFITAVIETCMLIRGSSYAEGITLEGIVEELDALELTDPYKLEFRELIRGLIINKETDY